jgi:hypothetical protein
VPKRTQPRRRFFLQTSQAVYEEGAVRQVTVEAQDGYAVLRLKGMEDSYPIPWGTVYHLAAAQAAKRELHARKSRIDFEGII